MLFLRVGGPVPNLLLASLACAVISMTTFVDAGGQTSSISEGVVQVQDWPKLRVPVPPATEASPLDYREYRLLPFIESLSLGYRFRVENDRPAAEFVIEWEPGQSGVLDGRVVPRHRLPENLSIESIDLLASVVVAGATVADFRLSLDTLNLGPTPSYTVVDVFDMAWDSVFVGSDAGMTREIVASGFNLDSLRILRIVFDATHSDPDDEEPRHRPDYTTVCVPDAGVWVTWRGGNQWRHPRKRVTKAERDRRGEISRGSLVPGRTRNRGSDRDKPDPSAESDTDQTQRRGRDRKTDRAGRPKLPSPDLGDDDDDDDDKDRFLPAAIAGVAAIGGLAIVGGTVGYFGSIDKAPVGFTSGYVRPRGGVLLQVAVNPQVYSSIRGSENFVASIVAFRDVFRSAVQPALGVGVRLTEEGTEDWDARPSVSLGVVGNLGRIVLYVGYDIEASDVRVSLALNFRAPKQEY